MHLKGAAKSALLLLLGAIFSGLVWADPMGINLILNRDSQVAVYFAGSEAGYTSTLCNVTDVSSTQCLFSNHPGPDYGVPFALGFYEAGTKLRFRLDVWNTGDHFFTGPASANPDQTIHAKVSKFAGDALVPAGVLVGFEDLWGGGDRDYNDVSFIVVADEQQARFREVDATIPEPTSALLLLSAAGVTALLFRKSR